LKKILLPCAALFSAVVAFAVTFNLALDGVRDANGNFVPVSTLVLVVVDTAGDGFGANVLANGSSAVGGTFGGTDDLIVWRGDFGGGDTGAFFDAVNFSMTAAAVPNDRAIQFVWLPTLTTSSLTLVSSASYGTYTSTNATQFGSSSSWSTGGSDSAVYRLNAFATNNTGNLADNLAFPVRLADSVLTANFSVVPEPSTYAALFGVVALAGTIVWRRRGASRN